MKKLVSILLSAIVTASSLTNVFAVSDEFYSADETIIRQELTQMTDSDREEFINENLDVDLQDMSILVTLTANQDYDQIAEAVEKSISDGLTAVQIKEAIYQSAPYCGYTRAIKAMDEADAALTALDIELPSESRITSDEETRYDDGLAAQRHIFGPSIGTITDDMSQSQKLQTLYLSGICFGDFYNRQGLSLNTREFLTFCTIAANGTCLSQVASHITGNLNVGHSKDMLRAALLVNEEYNGEEKTVEALKAINENTQEPSEDVVEPTAKEAIDIEEYTTDSQELTDIMVHYQTDDADGYIDENLDAQMQKIVLDAVNAYIDQTAAVTSDNEQAQSLVDLILLGAEGGRESDVPAVVAENLSAGNTADMMLAAIYLCTPYNGFPRTLNIVNAVNSALENAESITITMQIGNPTMTINGAEKGIDEDGTVPVIVNDRTLLPIRAVVEEIGGTVAWNDETREVTLTYEQDTIVLTIDSTTAYLNGEPAMLDTAPAIINDRTMLPIRFIAESFKFNVGWTQETETVTITKTTLAKENVTEPESSADENEAEENKTLIVYFSATGNTESLAEKMQDVTNGDIAEIVPAEPYTSEDLNYNDSDCRANQELNTDARPQIQPLSVDIEQYDTIVLGYPIWWGQCPPAVRTFLENYDLSGKKIMPFCTSGSSGISGSLSKIHELCPDSTVTEGFRGTNSTTDSQIESWLDNNGYTK